MYLFFWLRSRSGNLSHIKEKNIVCNNNVFILFPFILCKLSLKQEEEDDDDDETVNDFKVQCNYERICNK